MLLYSIIVNMAILPFAAMALLTARDAILPSQRERYDRAMSTIARDQSFHFYRVRHSIRLDISEQPTRYVRGLYVRISFHSHVNKVIRREFFWPSADADAYFEQERALADRKNWGGTKEIKEE